LALRTNGSWKAGAFRHPEPLAIAKNKTPRESDSFQSQFTRGDE
jgi:hypothetical protein